MPPDITKDPIIDTYIKLFQAKLGDKIKGYYYGDPVRVPASRLPCIIVSKRATTAGMETNVEDMHEIALVITVITDIRQDIQDDTTLVAGVTSLYDIMEGRDPATLQLKPISLLGIIRANVDIGVGKQLWTDLSTKTKLDYGMTIGKRQVGMYSVEGSITLVANFIQLR